MKTSFCVCCSRLIHEAHKHTITVGGLRIHALLQSSFEVSSRNARRFFMSNWKVQTKRRSQVTLSFRHHRQHRSAVPPLHGRVTSSMSVESWWRDWRHPHAHLYDPCWTRLFAPTCPRYVCLVFDFMVLVLSAKRNKKKGFLNISRVRKILIYILLLVEGPFSEISDRAKLRFRSI